MQSDETYLKIAEEVIHALAISDEANGTSHFPLFRRGSKQVLASAIQSVLEQEPPEDPPGFIRFTHDIPEEEEN